MVHELSFFDGAAPAAGLMGASDGMLYGTTRGGGFSGLGVVFRVDFAQLASLDRGPRAGVGMLASGGVPLTTRGEHFRPGMAATLGEAPFAIQEDFDHQNHFGVTPPLSPGTLYDVTVTNTDGQSATLPQGLLRRLPRRSLGQPLPRLHRDDLPRRDHRGLRERAATAAAPPSRVGRSRSSCSKSCMARRTCRRPAPGCSRTCPAPRCSPTGSKS